MPTGYQLLSGEWVRIRVTGSFFQALNSACLGASGDSVEVFPNGAGGYLAVRTPDVDSLGAVNASSVFVRDSVGGGWVRYQGNEKRDRSTSIWVGWGVGQDPEAPGTCWTGSQDIPRMVYRVPRRQRSNRSSSA